MSLLKTPQRRAVDDLLIRVADVPDVARIATLRCARCGAMRLIPSRRRPWDWFMRTVSPRRPFRCMSCHARSWWNVAKASSWER